MLRDGWYSALGIFPENFSAFDSHQGKYRRLIDTDSPESQVVNGKLYPGENLTRTGHGVVKEDDSYPESQAKTPHYRRLSKMDGNYLVVVSGTTPQLATGATTFYGADGGDLLGPHLIIPLDVIRERFNILAGHRNEFSAKEVALFSCLSLKVIDRWLASGVLPPPVARAGVGHGGARLFCREACFAAVIGGMLHRAAVKDAVVGKALGLLTGAVDRTAVMS